MTKKNSKITSVIFGIIAIYFTINLIPDKTKKTEFSLNKEYQFTNEIDISEKFMTDFESSYGIHMDMMNSSHKGIIDTILPLSIDLKIVQNGKLIKLCGDYKNGYLMVNRTVQLSSFLSKENTVYEIKLNIKDNNITQKKVRLNIATNVPGPSYELLIEREFKWIFWIIDSVIILITLIAGYFGFRKKPAGNNV